VTPWVKRLIIANVGIFFLQYMSQQNGLIAYLLYNMTFVPRQALTHPWTVITYQFLHGGFAHIFFNMLGLYFFGPRVEERIGSNRFLILYLFSGIVGALCSFIFAPNAAVIGASGAVFGVMFAFARFWPDVQILLWFFPMPARVAVIVMAAMSLWSGWGGSRGGVADFAHLGGFLGGWIYLSYLERRQGVKRFRTKTVAPVGKDVLANYKKINTTSIHEINRDEVNRILDKISAKGLASLTNEERLFLSNFVPPDDRVPPPT
jgi:membrane associated rhomboid family serine protease